MVISTLTLFLIICLTCLLLYFRGNGKRGQLPPGPRPLPILGNMLDLDIKDMVKSLLTLREKFGSVFTIYMGSQPTVVLCGYKTVKKALVDQGEEFSGRGDMPVIFRFTQGDGIALSNGEKWKVLRRFAIQTLRNFGMGKRSIEERIQEEAKCLVKELEQTKGEPFDPTFLIGCSFSNVICSIVFGDRFDYKDEKFLTLVGLINDNFRLFNSPFAQIYNLYPKFMHCLPGPHHQIFANFERLRDFIREMVKAHQESFDPNCTRDFIDSFLLKIQVEKENPQSYFHTDTIVMTTHNLFFAGTETVSTTLRFAILILMKYPEIEAKVHEEITRVIGSQRSPSFEDRAQTPYTEAVIHEIQRFIDIFSMGIPHAVTKDTHFQGFVLPKGTNIMPFLHSVHYDPTQFKNPQKFDPAHFLNEKGEFRRNDAFMPFSAGKRLCLGEALARMEMFVFFVTLLQRFTFRPTCPPEEIDVSPLLSGLGNVPRPYKVQVIPR
ncbi:cytochrome P450 2F2-like isoform X2 [Tiliqua scincoides]|uniref:cytochrome P450 2F2-like isoform X2 n=1 Tax=Tiliqua scincoides TaxID=71010 RepID=UPI00346204AE